MADAYYFGCWGKPGHHLHLPGASRPRWCYQGKAYDELASIIDPRSIDGAFLPRARGQVEGEASVWIHASPPWTFLAFWDRSVDKRPGSSSLFILRGALNFEEALTAAQSAFPGVFRRFTFDIRMRANG